MAGVHVAREKSEAVFSGVQLDLFLVGEFGALGEFVVMDRLAIEEQLQFAQFAVR